MNRREKRIFDTELKVEKRDDGTAKAIEGHAAVFNVLSENLGGFREKIAEGAFDSVLDDDVRALIDHDSSKILGRSKAGNLKISVDKTGLKYRIEPVATRSYENDLIQSLERKDVDQSSFGFRVDEDKWEEDEDGLITRTIIKIRRLFDVSPVTFPAYPQTDVAKRSLDKWKSENEPPEDKKDENKGPTEDEIKESFEIKEKQLALMELEVNM